MPHVVVHVARPVTDPDRWTFLLDGGERARAERFRRAIDTARFVTGRAVAKMALAESLDTTADAVVFGLHCPNCSGTDHGKPLVPGVEFSIAHSGSMVMVAVCESAPVGVDVEEVSRRSEVDSLADAVFSPEERAEFERFADPERFTESERRAAFFTYWARKEALVKSTGLGFSAKLSSVTVTAPDAAPAVLSWDRPEPVRLVDLGVEEYEGGTDYRAALAVLTEGDVELEYRHFAA